MLIRWVYKRQAVSHSDTHLQQSSYLKVADRLFSGFRICKQRHFSYTMQMSYALFCISLCVFTAHLSRIHGMTLANPEKKGWTLNSAGYLLGPYVHRSLNVRHRATGKRDMWNESSSFPTSSYNDSYLLSLLGHLAYLRLKEMGITEDSSGSLTNGHMKQ